MKFSPIVILTLVAISVAPPPLCAQEPASADPPTPTEEDLRKASFTFRCAGWTSLSEVVYYRLVESTDPKKAKSAGPKFYPLKIYEMAQTRLYPQKAGREVTFYRRSDAAPDSAGGAGTAPELLYRKVGAVRVPEGTHRFTFLFFPKDKNGDYQIYVIPDDREDSPFGSYQFYNLAKVPIHGSLGGKRFVSQPGRPLNLQFEYREKRQLAFATWTGSGKDRRWLQRNSFTYSPNKHLKYFFYPTAERNGRTRLSAKGLVEFFIPTPPAGPVEISPPTGEPGAGETPVPAPPGPDAP